MREREKRESERERRGRETVGEKERQPMAGFRDKIVLGQSKLRDKHFRF